MMPFHSGDIPEVPSTCDGKGRGQKGVITGSEIRGRGCHVKVRWTSPPFALSLFWTLIVNMWKRSFFFYGYGRDIEF